MKHSRTSKQSGFTLVELAIVIVIIGLIVGGILVGQDLIKAATVRATLSDLEKYNSAATTFRNKYSGLPGDLLATYATQFGFGTGAASRDGAAGRGDGNALIEGCAATATALGCETALFWQDMSTAGLIPQRLGTYVAATDSTVATVTTIAAMQGYLPLQKLRQGTFQYMYPINGKNHFGLGTIVTGAAGAVTIGAGITPGEARSMDEKLDDALPATGVVQAITDLSAAVDAGAAAAATVCVDSTPTPDTYNVGQNFIDNINCRMRFRASF